jgi:predicted AlkP superfamily phosphohydrolase/phosphomutase
MEKMTYKEAVTMRKNLDAVNQVAGTSARFLYAVSRNKDHLDSVIKHLNKTVEASKDIQEYRKEIEKINLKHSLKDEDGSVQYTNVPMPNGMQRRAFKKIVGEGNPDSEYEKEVAKLEKKFDKQISEHEARIKKYEEMLDSDIPADDLRLFMIDLDIVPDGLHPRAMDGIIPFIKEEVQQTSKE